MLSSLKRFFGGKPAFEIVQSATGTAAGDKPAVLLSAALHSPSGQEAMVSALVEQFKIQRMISPAETDLLLITVAGPCDAPRFIERWRALVTSDQIAEVFMQRMAKADLGCTDARSFHSLLSAPKNA
jgi:hypothetical protein